MPSFNQKNIVWISSVTVLFLIVFFGFTFFPSQAQASCSGLGAVGDLASSLGFNVSGATVKSAVSTVQGAAGSVTAVPVKTVGSGDVQQQSDISAIRSDLDQTTNKTCNEDGIAQFIAKYLIQQLTNSIVTWINTGFNGSPSFIQNPGSFFSNVADRIAGQAIANIAPFLCSPFKLNLSLMLALSYGAPAQNDIGCTLTAVEGNLNNFATSTAAQANQIANGGASGGGWQSWFHVTQNQNNNPDGALLKAQAQMSASISTAQGNISLPLSWSHGFLGSEDCSGAGNYTTKSGTTNVYDSTNAPVYGVSANQDGCVTKTPGVVIEGQLNNVVGGDLQGLNVAQSLDQIFSALEGQLLTQVIGAVGLSGASTGPSTTSVGALSTPITGSCLPNKNAAGFNNDPVVWTAYIAQSSGTGLVYTWSGTDMTTGTSTNNSITMLYSIPGTKTVSVTVTRPQQQAGGLIIPGAFQTFQCAPNVLASPTQSTAANAVPQPNVSGVIDQTGTSNLSCTATASNVPIDAPTVTYNVFDSSPSQTTSYNYALNSNDSSEASITNSSQNPALNNGITVTYVTPGSKQAVVTVQKQDGEQWSANCQQVTVQPFSCTPDSTTEAAQPGGNTVTWTVTPPGVAPGGAIRTYAWLNDSYLQNFTGSTVQGFYPNPGTYGAQLTVSETVPNTGTASPGNASTNSWTISCNSVTIQPTQ